jgi:hypothetical protein
VPKPSNLSDLASRELTPHPYAMGTQLSTRTAVRRWSVVGVLGIWICAEAGILFGQITLWGTVAAVTVLYMGSMGIWFSHRDSTENLTSNNIVSRRASSSLTGVRTSLSWRAPETYQTANGASMEIGSPEFTNVIHDLAQRVDDPTDIVDSARRAGIKMSLLRVSGSQTPLNLWTAILTRAVRDGKVERLMAEVHRSDDLPEVGQ